MKTDMTLLEKDGAPTITELKAFFRDNDFSTQVSRYDPVTATDKQNGVYIKAKKHFLAAWNEQMKALTGKGSLLNFSSNAPVRCLEEANEKLIAGTMMEIITNEVLYENIIDSFFMAFENDIHIELEKYAKTHNRVIEELTEAEFSFVFDKFAALFLATMVNKLMQTQSVSEVMDISKKMAVHEDFAKTVNTNYDKIDFKRKWDHTRTKIGVMESLDQLIKDEHNNPDSVTELSTVEEEFEKAEKKCDAIKKLNAFYNYLGNDTDRMIFKMHANGCTQKEIAMHLRYKTHSAVGKRLKKIEEKRQAFLKLKQIECY